MAQEEVGKIDYAKIAQERALKKGLEEFGDLTQYDIPSNGAYFIVTRTYGGASTFEKLALIKPDHSAVILGTKTSGRDGTGHDESYVKRMGTPSLQSCKRTRGNRTPEV